ncbi:MAG: potassium-transporting ATPase subunit F [Acidimicrobiales bacterium]
MTHGRPLGGDRHTRLLRRLLGAGGGPGANRVIVDWVLLAAAAILFAYLGVALFKPEWF